MDSKTLRIILLSRLPIHGEVLNRKLKKISNVIWIGQKVPIKLNPFTAPFLLLYELLCLMYHHSFKFKGQTPIVVVVHFISLDALVATLFKKICHYQVVLYALGSDVLGINNSFERVFLKWIISKVDRVLCVTEDIASYLKILGRFDVVVLPTPFAKPKEKQFCDKECDIITVGALIPLKKHDLLIQACAHLNPNLTVSIIGGGPRRHYLNELANQTGRKIKLMGWIDHERILCELQKAKVYVHTSLREGIPASILEAIWCELPVIVVDSSYVNDLKKRYGFKILVVERSPTALASAIEKVLREYEQFREIAMINSQLLREYVASWENNILTIFNRLVRQANEECCDSFEGLRTEAV